MSRRLMCRSCTIVLSLFVLFPFHVQNFSYPAFSSHNGFISLGNTKHDLERSSFMIEPNTSHVRLYGDQLVHLEKVRMKNPESNMVASFSTSFTFSITQVEQFNGSRSGWLQHVCGFIFIFVSNYNASVYNGHVDFGVDYFGLEFDTYNSYGDEDPSDNHIGVNINSPKTTYTYNLCSSQRTSCSFPWTGQHYTTLIAYNGSTQSLEIWFANGSVANIEVKLTGTKLIHVPKVDLSGACREYMYVAFSGNPGPFSDSYEILSWNFTSDYLEHIPAAPNLMLSHVAATCGIVVLIAVCILGYWWIMTRPITQNASELEIIALMGLRRFSFTELKRATKNFSKDALLGKGGSRSVYKGILPGSDIVVAVKRLKHNSEHVERAFLAEVSTVNQIRHRNLVQLLGWCHEGHNFMLVFEYMSNGSLDEWLFPSRRRHPHDPKYERFKVLPWELRISILAGVAATVEYMHEDWVQCVLHHDIKSSNVMIDVDFNPHLGDFGLSRLIDHKKLEKTTLMAGTLGYMAPEMNYTGKATKESDVYSFGILILEVTCGRKPINLLIEDPEKNCLLVQDVRLAYEGGSILNAIAPELLFVYSQEQSSTKDVNRGIVPLLHLGLRCCFSDPTSRPSMRVVKQLILQLQGSDAEGAMAMLNSMPPLSSTMPIYSFFSHVPESFIEAMEREVPLDDRQVLFLPRTDTTSMLRHRSDSKVPAKNLVS